MIQHLNCAFHDNTHTHTQSSNPSWGTYEARRDTRQGARDKAVCLFKENKNVIKKMFLCATSCVQLLVCVRLLGAEPRVFFTSDELSSPQRRGQSCFSFLFSSSLSAAAVCLKRCDRTAHTSDKHLVHLVARLHNLRLRRAPTDTFSCFKSQDSMFLALLRGTGLAARQRRRNVPGKIKGPEFCRNCRSAPTRIQVCRNEKSLCFAASAFQEAFNATCHFFFGNELSVMSRRNRRL